MKKTILTYGLISGALASVMMTINEMLAGKIGFDKAEYLGYAVIVLSFLLVFFGIRSYRDNEGNGQITFGRAFTIGISITLIMCVCYVASWEVIYFNFMHDFMDKYSAYVIGKAKASGATQAAIQAQTQQLANYKQMYDTNPLYNVAMTFLEPFPVGLIITLISAAVLRRKPKLEPSGSPVAASS